MSLFFANFMFLLTSVAAILASFGLVEGGLYEKNLSARPLLFFIIKRNGIDKFF